MYKITGYTTKPYMISIESVEIKVPNKFYPLIRGDKVIYVKPGKTNDILKDKIKNYPALAEKIINDKCELAAGIILFKDEETVSIGSVICIIEED